MKNRKIRFRTYNLYTKKMNKNPHFYPDVDEFDNEIYLNGIFKQEHDGGYMSNDCFIQHKIIFMQFTGLKDISGKDIYEGDIVRSNKKNNGRNLIGRNIGEVKYGIANAFDGCCGFTEMIGFYVDSGIIDEISGTSCTHLSNDLNLEILGNIYINSNILNKKNV